jgi:predicted transcriptional regulator
VIPVEDRAKEARIYYENLRCSHGFKPWCAACFEDVIVAVVVAEREGKDFLEIRRGYERGV